MKKCFITQTGAFLPGRAVENEEIHRYIGRVFGESAVKQKILSANGIGTRHYALDERQNPTHNVYELGAEAVEVLLKDGDQTRAITYLSAGTTNSPLIAPGIASLLHRELTTRKLLRDPIEINSCSGVCSSGAQALTNAYRAITSGQHEKAICVGAEQPSAILKSSAIRPKYDFKTMLTDLKQSQWFMQVFLRFMLSDGAGSFLLEDSPSKNGLSFEIKWVFSRSFANEAPLCMKLEPEKMRLSQDIGILGEHMFPCARKAVSEAMAHYGEFLSDYHTVLPHLSSYYFKSKMEKVLKDFSSGAKPPQFWTNLATVGNTGAASIFIILDEFARTQTIKENDRILLFVPESGQFNYVLVSLMAVKGE